MTPDEIKTYFPASVKAVAVYKAEMERIDALFPDAQTPEAIEALFAEEEAAANSLRDAFWHDTRDHNNRATLQRMNPKSIVRLIETGSFYEQAKRRTM